MNNKVSPMMKQYLDIKAVHQEHILFFRLGDFYEMFFEDAIHISKELNLTLTARDCGLPDRAPMCGIPYHAADNYIKKLIDAGYKVAICEQTENPATAKGLVNREVTRIITPGTVIEKELLDDTKNNYIASFYMGDNRNIGICFADISTGELQLTQCNSENPVQDLLRELTKFMPVEILCNCEFGEYDQVQHFMKMKLQCSYSPFEQEKIDLSKSEESIKQHFKIDDLSNISLDNQDCAIRALGGLIQYLNLTQPDGAKRIQEIHFYHQNDYMSIDVTARSNLELTNTIRLKETRGTLLWVLDHTKTAMGKRFMRKSVEQPLLSISGILNRQDAVKELVNNNVTGCELQRHLTGVSDLERLMTRVLYGTINPREMQALYLTLKKMDSIKELLEDGSAKLLQKIYDQIDPHHDVCNLLENALVDIPPIVMKEGGFIRTGFHDMLDELRTLCQDVQQVIQTIEQQQRELTGIKTLKIKYNRVFGYYIEVSNAYLNMVPEEYIRKQTLAGCERYITQPLKELETKILSASEKSKALEQEIFGELRSYVASKIHTIQKTADGIATLDFLCSLASVATNNHYICPTITQNGKIYIQDARHPVVEQMLTDQLFVPNDIHLDQDSHRTMVITGPNMAGKSTYMRQVAILSIMAQIGSFLPAKSAEITLVDSIFTRVGASDDLSSGQSTFMVEMSEVAHILRNATGRSLVILDEIGRGTSTFDGMSIAKAVVEYITNQKHLRCKTLFATHYHELTSMETEFQGVKNYNIAVKKQGDDVIFLRKILPGGADESFGIEVAKLAGIPPVVVERSKQYLQELENQTPVKQVNQPVGKEENISLNTTLSPSIVEQQLKNICLDTLTPMEAMNIIYRLKQLL